MSPDPAEAALFAGLSRTFDAGPPTRLGVAVSGGGDSLALLHLAHRAYPGAVLAVTVDHGLRPESADEAEAVAAFCASHAIAHQTLRWSGPLPSGNLMDQARQARRYLIAAWAKAQDCPDILLGHTADDQAETLLMNLARGTGLDGLCGLRARWSDHGVTWHRPLLTQTRAALRNYLIAQNISWTDDPSNDNSRFTRSRARRALKALKPLGLTVERLVLTAQNLASAREAILQGLAHLAKTHITESAGALLIDAALLGTLPDDSERRLLIAAMRWIAQAPHPPREAQLDRLRAALHQRRDATLGGVRFRWKPAHLLVSREPRAAQNDVPFGLLWDQRWQVSGLVPDGAVVRALGAEGLANCPDWRAFGPREALIVTPSVWSNGQLIAAPLAGLPGPCDAMLRNSFAKFMLSH